VATIGFYGHTREETVENKKNIIILERELIGTISADENELRLRRFQWRWKALGKLGYQDF
jgi:hypothetical protein